MRPLNFAILKYLTTVDEACPEDIIEALKGTYGSFRALNKKDIISALMTAEVNGLVQESRFELDGTLREGADVYAWWEPHHGVAIHDASEAEGQ